MSRKQVVLLGGGYVSVCTYKALYRCLGRQIRNGDIKVTCISADNFHSFHGWTGEVVGGIIAPSHQLTPLRTIMPHATILSGWVTAIDSSAQTVRCYVQNEVIDLHYDQLVLGVGSYDKTSEIEGLEKYGLVLKTGGLYALMLRDHLIRMLERAETTSDAQERNQLLNVVVAGGGLTGTELMGIIAELWHDLKKYYPSLTTDYRLVLAHSGEALLPELRPRHQKLADYAQRQILAYGVEVHLKTRLTRVTAEGAYLSDGSFISSKTVISCSGQQPALLSGVENEPKDDRNRLQTDSFLRLLQQPTIWAGGDVASVPHPKSGKSCPANALWAIMHGYRIGNNLARVLFGKHPRKFSFPGLGTAFCVGIGKSGLELYNLQFTGWLAYIMRLGFFLHFIPSKRLMIRVLLDWLSFPFSRRHIVPLQAGNSKQIKTPIMNQQVMVNNESDLNVAPAESYMTFSHYTATGDVPN